LVRIGAPAVEPLIAALQDEKDAVRQAAVKVLGEIGDARVVEGLLTRLEDESWIVRGSAAEALGRIGDARAVEGLLTQLEDEDEGVRGSAAEALGRIGDARAIGGLLARLEDKDPSVRWMAAEALGRIGDARAMEPLTAALQDSDGDVRRAATEALVKIGAPAVGPLTTALKNEKDAVRHAAAEALEQIGWRPDWSEAGAIYWIMKREWGKCVEIGAPAVEPLIAALKNRNKDVRQAATEALGKIGDARAVEPLIAVLTHDQREDMRAVVAAALDELNWQPDAAEAEEAAVAYWTLKRRWDKLEQIGSARAIRPLISHLETERDQAVSRRASLRKDIERLHYRSLGYDGSGLAVINEEVRSIEEEIKRIDKGIAALDAKLNRLRR
jgi:HEAT repeat protein